MPDENKSDKNKGSGDDANKILTVEEIQAIAKKAEAALAGDDDKDKNKGGDDKDKSDNDDEFVLDPKNIDTDKTLKYIDKLKDENARRRIANKKADDKLGKLTTELTSAKDALMLLLIGLRGLMIRPKQKRPRKNQTLRRLKRQSMIFPRKLVILRRPIPRISKNLLKLTSVFKCKSART